MQLPQISQHCQILVEYCSHLEGRKVSDLLEKFIPLIEAQEASTLISIITLTILAGVLYGLLKTINKLIDEKK